MINNRNIDTAAHGDAAGLAGLRRAARAESPEAVRETARQFEALFLNMVMKSMREATVQHDPLASEQSKMFTGMLDQQLSQGMAARGVGLADALVRQLSQMRAQPPAPAGQDATVRAVAQDAPAPGEAAAASTKTRQRNQPEHVRLFESRLRSHAEQASRETGIPAKFMLAQAALESGWGRREIKGSDGASSHNLFGIKAGADWKGPVVETLTTEYVNGVAVKKVERFRAYSSYAESFRDYGRLITENPRYKTALASVGDARAFAGELQRAGYATDPQYAAKMTSIITRTLSA